MTIFVRISSVILLFLWIILFICLLPFIVVVWLMMMAGRALNSALK